MIMTEMKDLVTEIIVVSLLAFLPMKLQVAPHYRKHGPKLKINFQLFIGFS